MRPCLYAFSAVLLTILSAALPAGAASFNKVTSPGQPVRIGSHAFWDKTCQGQPASVQIVEQPQHGRLSARVELITVRRIDYGSAPCMGHQVMGRAVYYTPQPGFVGTDQFYYVSLKRNGNPVPQRGSVTVR